MRTGLQNYSRPPCHHLCSMAMPVLIISMLDHPITVVLNVFWHWKATWLKVSKFMGIQNQEEHIGHVKQLKSDRYQDHKFLSQA